MVIVTKFLHIWHNGVDVMAEPAPFTPLEGNYADWSYRIKGDGRVQLIHDADNTTTLHQNVNNALHWVDMQTYGPDPAPGFEPVLDSISPNTAALGDPPLTMTCTGSNFLPTSRIIFNGGAENTIYVSDTELTTQVEPETATVTGEFPVEVRSGSYATAPQMFSFTEAEPA